MSKYEEAFRKLRRDFYNNDKLDYDSFNEWTRIKQAIEKAKKYDDIMANSTEWYIIGMKEALSKIKILEEENLFLKAQNKCVEHDNQIFIKGTKIIDERTIIYDNFIVINTVFFNKEEEGKIIMAMLEAAK